MTDAWSNQNTQRTQGLIALDCFPGAEISDFFFPLCFLPSLLKSPTSSGGCPTSQNPVRAAEGLVLGLVLRDPPGLDNPPVVANQCKPEAPQFEVTINGGGEACKEIPISR